MIDQVLQAIYECRARDMQERQVFLLIHPSAYHKFIDKFSNVFPKYRTSYEMVMFCGAKIIRSTDVPPDTFQVVS